MATTANKTNLPILEFYRHQHPLIEPSNEGLNNAALRQVAHEPESCLLNIGVKFFCTSNTPGSFNQA